MMAAYTSHTCAPATACAPPHMSWGCGTSSPRAGTTPAPPSGPCVSGRRGPRSRGPSHRSSGEFSPARVAGWTGLRGRICQQCHIPGLHYGPGLLCVVTQPMLCTWRSTRAWCACMPSTAPTCALLRQGVLGQGRDPERVQRLACLLQEDADRVEQPCAARPLRPCRDNHRAELSHAAHLTRDLSQAHAAMDGYMPAAMISLALSGIFHAACCFLTSASSCRPSHSPL